MTKFCQINKTVTSAGTSRIWSFNLRFINHSSFVMSEGHAWKGFAMCRQCITACITNKNGKSLEHLCCRAEDPFVFEWDSWCSIDVTAQVTVGIQAFLGERKSHSIISNCSFPEFLWTQQLLLPSQDLQLFLSNHLFQPNLNNTGDSFEEQVVFQRKKASQLSTTTGPDKHCKAVIKMWKCAPKHDSSGRNQHVLDGIACS